MGTRADFYIGRNPETMNWLGSIAWDGYPDGLPDELLSAKTKDQFMNALAGIAEREDFTMPAMGWPWPWEDSNTTDYAYAFDEGQVWVACFGHGWVTVDIAKDSDYDWDQNHPQKLTFPDMTSIQKIDFGERSGLLIIGWK